GTLHVDDVILRMENKQIATKNVNGKAFVEQFHSECIEAVSENFNVTTGLFQAGLGFNGTVEAKDLGHHVQGEAVHAHVRISQGEEAREAMKKLTVSVAEQPAPVGPVVQAILNPVAGVPDVLNTGAMVLIRGMRLAVRGDKVDDIGVFFIPVDGSDPTRVPATQLSPHTASRLQFVLPAEVTSGQYQVKVATQSTASGSTLTKDVREYVYPNPVTVV
ncbi:MAG: DUF4469 domain-containing protein, partial [Tannerella sp.]|nr:DUF4469 domain-containing protein [Tannerella sp.]